MGKGIRGSYCPPSHEIEVDGNTAVMRFYENVEEINEVDETGGDRTFVGWEFDRYTIKRPYDDGLPGRVERDVPGWLELAKREERDKLTAEVISTRARLIAETDWTVLPDVPMSPEKRAEWEAYRQALRDVDAVHAADYPYGIVWSAKPA